MGRPLIATLMLLAASPCMAEASGFFHRLAAPAGVARLVKPPGMEAPPLVVILPDALGEDGRAEPYVGALAARGIATLLLGVGEDHETPDRPVEPASHPAAVGVALGWAVEAGFAASRIGVLGFGLGARAALASASGLPAVALYPGCTGLDLPAQGPVLLLQGEDTAQGCDGLARPPSVTLRLLPGAGHGWDAPGAIWPLPGPLLPDPAGGSVRLRARADLEVTLRAAEAAADWFEDRLLAGHRRAAR